MGLWITLGIFTLLAILPLGVRVCYDADGPLVKILLGPLKLTVFPRTKKKVKPEKEKKQKPEAKTVQQEEYHNAQADGTKNGHHQIKISSLVRIFHGIPSF